MNHVKILAVVIALVFAVTYLISTRYQIASAGGSVHLWMLDTWTGDVYICNPTEARRDCISLPKHQLLQNPSR